MCFVIAGVQPKTRTLADAPRRCPRCGLYQAYNQQVDHYLSLFFIPLFRIKKGVPFLYCRRCELPIGPEAGPTMPSSADSSARMCSQCGRALEQRFKYCPHCGQRQ